MNFSQKTGLDNSKWEQLRLLIFEYVHYLRGAGNNGIKYDNLSFRIGIVANGESIKLKVYRSIPTA